MQTKRERILSALQALNPIDITLVDESHTHANGYESHYKLTIVSPQFNGLNSLKRHQMVYGAMGLLMKQIHALAIHTFTPEEWCERNMVPESPACTGSH